MKILATMVLAASFTLAAPSDKACRSLVKWTQDRVETLESRYNVLETRYKLDLEKYKRNELKLSHVNMMWILQEEVKKFTYDPKQYNERVWVENRRQWFMNDCGGFNKRDRNLSIESVRWKWKIRKLVVKIITNPYFERNWNNFQNVEFPGVGSYGLKTGYEHLTQ